MIKVDCTLVRATHRDLKRLSADRGFREDLFYRITGLGVALPALRERRALFAPIQHLLCAETIAHQPLLLSTAALEALMAYHWRGNFRLLHQTLRLAAALAKNEGEIGLHHSPGEVLEGREAQAESGEVTPQAHAGDTLQVSKLRAIKAAVEASGGNLAAAARSLGIWWATLCGKLREMEVSQR